MDLATLKIVIDASQVGPATAALKGLGATGVQVQTATGGATVGMGRLNNAILALARQATGAHPVMARFADVLFSMALGGAKMTAVLGGIAALALAYRKLTEESRNARAEAERLVGVLDKLRSEGGPGDLPGAIRGSELRLAQMQAQMATLRQQIAFNRARGFTATADRQQRELMDLAFMSATERERLRAGVNANATVLPGLDVTIPGPFRDSGTGRLTNGQNFFAGSPTASVDVGRMGARLEERKRELDAWFAYQRNAEEALNQRRIQANQALVLSLANVGRAYGGVVDQVLNLTAATMSIHQAGRLPGFGRGETASRGDMAIGLGSAALTGIGFGTSTGNAGLGGIAGGLSGFAMAGPAGAIVGALGGIVSGVFEAGRRAREAQRMWQMALDDFALMFDEITPQMTLEREFKKLSGGFTPEQIRGLVSAADAGQFTGLTSAGVETLRRLLVEYEKNAVQANELAVAEKRLHDARRDVLQALNAPAGLNLAAYGYSASSSGAMVVQGDFIVHVDGGGDARETALRVFEEGRRRMLQGGQSPYLDVPR